MTTSTSSMVPLALTAVTIGMAVIWSLWRSRGVQTNKEQQSSVSPAAAPKRDRQASITPSFQRRQASMTGIAVPPKFERRRSSVINRDAASDRIQQARANPSCKQDFEDLTEEIANIKPPRLWQDPCFPHSEESMFLGGIAPKDWLRDGERGRVLKDVKVSWEGPWTICGTKRPLGQNSRGERSWLFHCLEGEACGMDAHDVRQGSLGDCYFLSALALVATDTCCADGLVDDVFDATGCYGVSFWVHGRWQMVWVDSFFPCYTPINKHSSTAPKPIYAASNNRREIWPMVVEKAFAKLHGSYQAIGGGGQIAAALQALTGGNAWTVPTSAGADRLWTGLLTAVEDPNVLVGAGTRKDTSAETRRGIVDGHAYSVLHAVEVESAGKSPREAQNGKGVTSYRLLLLRNPWGHGEWNGPWCDSSREWNEHPEAKMAVGDCRSTEDDGDFWMDIDSFCAIFASVDMCRLPGGHRHRTKNAELHPLREEDVDGASPGGSAGDMLGQAEDWLAGTAAAASPFGKGKAAKSKRKKK